MTDGLDDTTYEQITQLAAVGDAFVEDGKYAQALEQYHEALALLPPPMPQWEAATWLLTALGETYFFNRQYEQARQVLQAALQCPDGLGNPLIHLRLGQVQFELGNMDRAQDELVRAYMGGDDEIFEDEEPKYFDLVKTSIVI